MFSASEALMRDAVSWGSCKDAVLDSVVLGLCSWDVLCSE